MEHKAAGYEARPWVELSDEVVRVLYVFTHCRGVGCIFFEMTCGRPMFPGSSVEEELMLMWKVREQMHCNSVAS